MGADVHGPRWGIGHASGSAMLLVPDTYKISVTQIMVNLKLRQRGLNFGITHVVNGNVHKFEKLDDNDLVINFCMVRSDITSVWDMKAL